MRWLRFFLLSSFLFQVFALGGTDNSSSVTSIADEDIAFVFLTGPFDYKTVSSFDGRHAKIDGALSETFVSYAVSGLNEAFPNSYKYIKTDGFDADDFKKMRFTRNVKQVHFVIIAHGIIQGKDHLLEVQTGRYMRTEDLALVMERRPPGVKVDFSFLACHVGAIDPSIFPNNVAGTSPSEGMTIKSQFQDLLWSMKSGAGGKPTFPRDSREFFNMYRATYMNRDGTLKPYNPNFAPSPGWYSERLADGSRVNHGNLQLGDDELSTRHGEFALSRMVNCGFVLSKIVQPAAIKPMGVGHLRKTSN